MNYDTMEAGPEMDQLVGLKCTDFESVWIRNGKCRCIRKLINNAHDDEEEWSPSTNLLHAWEVVERLKALGHGFEILDNPGHIRVRINYGESAVVMARTVPMGICRCALAALKSTHKEPQP